MDRPRRRVRARGCAQFGEGVRIRPALAAGYLRLNYSANFQQFVAGDSVFSFQRLTTEFAASPYAADARKQLDALKAKS